MFDQVDNELETWCRSVQSRIEVRLGMADAEHSQRRTAWLHLHQIDPATHGAVDRRLNLELNLVYVVGASARDPGAAHALLGQLLRAALEHPRYEVELGAIDPALWTSRGLPVQPAFRLVVPWTWEREAEKVPFVEEVTLDRVPLADLAGVLLGPTGIPMARERVRIPRLKASVETDGEGGFRFQAIPADPARELELQIRHRRYRVRPGAQPTTIQFTP